MQLQEIKRFARYFDIFYNAENFKNTIDLLFKVNNSAYKSFNDFSNFIWNKTKRTHKFSMANQIKLLFDFLLENSLEEKETIVEAIEKDYFSVEGRKDKLSFLREG